MSNAAALGGFVAGAILVSLAWGRALWYFSERSQAVRRWVFFAMGYTHRQFGEVRALILSVIYYILGLFGAILFAIVLHLHVSSLISFSASHVALALLGIVGEISLANLLIDLSVRIAGMGGQERFAEMREIPWMKGLQHLPPAVMPVAAAFGGVVEEVFFRGVILRVMTDRLLVAPMLAIAIAGALFVFQQLVQVRTAFQALVIGCGCAAISLVGGTLVVLTGSIVPAMIAHGSFVLFFMSQGNGTATNSYTPRAETATQ